MPDDVGDLVVAQAEVDRHEDSAVAADPPERREQPSGIVRHHRHPATHGHAQTIEPGTHGVGQFAHATECDLAHRRRGLVVLVDERDPIGVHDKRPIEMITDRKRHLHESPSESTGFVSRPTTMASSWATKLSVSRAGSPSWTSIYRARAASTSELSVVAAARRMVSAS